ncbi:helix-turn-helix domain-containing protein [Sphingomonas sp. Tas61C01]|uniref:helix-turn-helix domain-containing protein n=1 Tax=Sphingomonas sp. Tas61C01 TaxID=3458297 RepID=UPI00403EE3A7
MRGYLTTAQAAERLGIRTNSLERWRCYKRPSPPFTRIGSRIYYLEADVTAWIAAQRVDPNEVGPA